MGRLQLNFVFLFGAYGFSILYILWRHYKNIRDGGHGYLQGDWLINFADGPVRRGFSGELFLGLGELLNLSPLLVLGLVQAVILALVMATLLQIAWSKGLTDSLTLVLLSPALVLFWVNDIDAPFRKELLGYLVFVPLFLLRSRPVSNFRLALASALFGIAVAFHEANVVFFVPFALVLWLLLEKSRSIPWILLNGFTGLTSTVFSWLHMSVNSVERMCMRVVETGASPQVCTGSITWLSKDLEEVVQDGWQLVAVFGGVQNFILALLLVALLFGMVALLLKHSLAEHGVVPGIAICIASALPLYLLGADWGRWVSIQMFVLIFVFLAFAENRSWSAYGGTVPIATYIVVLCFNFSVGVYHMVPTPQPGFLYTLVNAFHNFLT